MALIDLKERFGERFRISIDPAAQGCRKIDPMYWIIPCRLGEIYPLGGEFLALLVNRPKSGNRLRSLPELTVQQVADDAIIFKFHVRDFEKIAKIAGAYRKRRVTAEQMRSLGLETAYRVRIRSKNQRSVVG